MHGGLFGHIAALSAHVDVIVGATVAGTSDGTVLSSNGQTYDNTSSVSGSAPTPQGLPCTAIVHQRTLLQLGPGGITDTGG